MGEQEGRVLGGKSKFAKYLSKCHLPHALIEPEKNPIFTYDCENTVTFYLYNIPTHT